MAGSSKGPADGGGSIKRAGSTGVQRAGSVKLGGGTAAEVANQENDEKRYREAMESLSGWPKLRVLVHYCERTPGINFFFFMFFRFMAWPKYDDLVQQINGMLLFGALMFTCAIALPLAFELEELPAIDRSYEHGGAYGCTVKEGEAYTYYYDKPYSQVVADRAFSAVYLSGISIWLSLVNFISLTNINTQDSYGEVAEEVKEKRKKKAKKTQDEKDDEALAKAGYGTRAPKKKKSKKKASKTGAKKKKGMFTASASADPPTRYEVRAWWQYGRWIYFLSTIALAGGCVSTFNCWGNIAVMKLPNVHMYNLCKSAGWVFSHVDEETGARIYVNGTVIAHPSLYDQMDDRSTSPDGWYGLWSGTIMIVILISFMVGGWGIMKADMLKYGKDKVPYFVRSATSIDAALNSQADDESPQKRNSKAVQQNNSQYDEEVDEEAAMGFVN